jgi:hypothetical protein
MHDLAELGMLLSGRATANRKDFFDARIEQAFAEDALADHSGGSEENYVHLD